MKTSNANFETDRSAQMFPMLTPLRVQTARRFASAEPRRFAPGEAVFAIGDRATPIWLVLEGSVEVSRRDGSGCEAPVATERPGQFTGEVSQLAGSGSLGAGQAGSEGCLAVPFDAAHLRALMIGSADDAPCTVTSVFWSTQRLTLARV